MTKRTLSSVLALLFCSLVLAPSSVPAQQPQGLDPEEMMRRLQDPEAMQRMAEQAEQTQKCMEGVDQARLEALQQRAEAASREIDRLCKAGEQDEALEKARALGREMRADATFAKVTACTRDMAEMMQDLGLAEIARLQEQSEPSEEDLCK